MKHLDGIFFSTFSILCCYVIELQKFKIIQLMCFKLECCCLVANSCPTPLWPPGLKSSKILCPWDLPGNNTGVDCNFLLWGIFPTQGLNSHLLHYRQILYPQKHQGSPPITLYALVSLKIIPAYSEKSWLTIREILLD